jgi:TPR repeat protein
MVATRILARLKAFVAMSLVVLAHAPVAVPLAAQPAPDARAACPEADPAHQLTLALELAAGTGREKNETLARQCLAAAAAAGNVRAQLELGLFLLAGKGGPADRAAARDWLARAADAGSEAAARTRDEIDRSAAPPAAANTAPAKSCSDTQDPNEQLQLALNQAAGIGVAKNEAEARACLAKAAEVGAPRAQLELAIFMLNGIGGAKDEAGAKNWLQRAADGGSDAARQMREELERRPTAQPATAPTPHGNRLVAFIVGGAFIMAWIWVVSGRPPWRWRRKDQA